MQLAEPGQVTEHRLVSQARYQQNGQHHQDGNGQVQPTLLEEGLEVALRCLAQRHLVRFQFLQLKLSGLQFAFHQGLLPLPGLCRYLQGLGDGRVFALLRQSLHIGQGLLHYG